MQKYLQYNNESVRTLGNIYVFCRSSFWKVPVRTVQYSTLRHCRREKRKLRVMVVTRKLLCRLWFDLIDKTWSYQVHGPRCDNFTISWWQQRVEIRIQDVNSVEVIPLETGMLVRKVNHRRAETGCQWITLLFVDKHPTFRWTLFKCLISIIGMKQFVWLPSSTAVNQRVFQFI